MRISDAERADFLAILATTPPYLARLAETARDEALLNRPGEKTWSVAEILVHIDACARVWGKSIDRISSVSGGVQENRSPRAQTDPAPVDRRSFNEVVSTFNERRRALLIQLATFGADDWERFAIIGGKQHTISTQIRRMALHEQTHLGQIEDALERQFRSGSLDT